MTVRSILSFPPTRKQSNRMQSSLSLGLRHATYLLCAVVLSFSLLAAAPAAAASKSEINANADKALASLYKSIPDAKKIADKAKGVLVFPKIIKAGLIIGGAGGEGVLRVGGKVDSYYTSASASLGLQAGGTTFGYIMFLMSNDAISYLKRSDGWEVGVGPSYVIGDEKYASKYTTTTEVDGVVVFFVNQQGAFAGGGIEGTKITQGLASD
jgi:lipid-binding SYLF domain-containing protein